MINVAVGGDVNLERYLIYLFPALLFVMVYFFKNKSALRWISTLIFLYICFLCTFGFDVMVRGAAVRAQEGGASFEFSRGIMALNDNLLEIRIAIVASASFLWLLSIKAEKASKDEGAL